MFGFNSMFGVYDAKTIQETCMQNEEFLEKVIEKLPYIGEDYKREKEKEQAIREGREVEEEPEEEEAEEVEAQPANESVLEKIKKGVGSYFSGWFGGNQTNNTGNVLPRDDQYTAVAITSPITEKDQHPLQTLPMTTEGRSQKSLPTIVEGEQEVLMKKK